MKRTLDIPEQYYYIKYIIVGNAEFSFCVDYYFNELYKGCSLEIGVIDEDFWQYYDYYNILKSNTDNYIACYVNKVVIDEMTKLRDAGIIFGYELGDYV